MGRHTVYRTLLLSVFSLLVLLFYSPVRAADDAYPTGLSIPSEKDRLWAQEHVIKVDPESLIAKAERDLRPSRWVNIEYLPKVGRQAWGACAAWASTYYYKTWQEAKEHSWKRPDPAVDPEHIMSPAFTFNLYNGGHDFYSEPPATTAERGDALPFYDIPPEFRYLSIYGATPVSLMGENEPPYKLPTADQIYAAFPYRANEVFLLDYRSDIGMEALKTHLVSGDLATITVTLHNNIASYPDPGPGIESEVLFDNFGGTYSGCGETVCNPNHALTVIGYDDDKPYIGADGQQHFGAMLLVNSWGANWGTYIPEAGERGFVWYGYDYFKSLTTGGANYMTDRIDYQPTLVGTYAVTHKRRGELNIKVMAGDPDNPDWEMDVLPFAGGDVWIDQTVPFDATDYAASTDVGWWLTVTDMDIPQLWYPPKTGTITSFNIKRMDGLVWKSIDAPVDTVDYNFSDPESFDRRLNISLVDKTATAILETQPGQLGHVWADFDGDNDFDLLLFDRLGYDDSTTECRLFVNEGSHGLVGRGCPIPYLSGGDFAVADMNGDGLVDVAVNGNDSGVNTTRIYYNLGNYLLSDSGISLPGSYGPLEWIDYNNDGRLDLSLLLDPAAYTREVGVMLQNKDGSFSAANLGLPKGRNFSWADYNRDGKVDVAIGGSSAGLYFQDGSGVMQAGPSFLSSYNSVLAWGDVDNDGWLDLVGTRYVPDTQGSAAYGEVWRNNHDSSFSLYATIPEAPNAGGMSWGDINNDGLSDLAMWGDFGDSQDRAGWNVQTRVMINNGDGTFTNAGFDLYGVYWLSNATADLFQWIDYDNDGDLDFTIGGIGSQPDGWPKRFALYVSKASQAEGFNNPNSPPLPPVQFSATRQQAGDPITFTWSPGSDTETAPAGLNYNVRIGRNPFGGEILAPDYSAARYSQQLFHSLDSNTLGLRLEPPDASAFYWSVQSVDAGHAVSEWSPPQLFSPQMNSQPGDLNGDRVIDVADLLRTARMAQGIEPANAAIADRNGDGKVDQRDTQIIEHTLLGSTVDSNVIGTELIGPEGGAFSVEGFELLVPAGAFSETVSLKLQSFEHDNPFDANNASPVFRLTGLPTILNKQLSLRMHSNAPESSTDYYFAVGESSIAFGDPIARRRFTANKALSLGNNLYEIRLPFSQSGLSESDGIRASGITQNKVIDKLPPVDLVLVKGFFSELHESDHFLFTAEDVSVDINDLFHLAASFEHAYNTLTSAPYFFKTTIKEGNKYNIYVKKMGAGEYGLQVASKLGGSYIEINYDYLSEKSAIEQSAIHEFFHYIQDLYDPQLTLSKIVFGPISLWLEEASSVWSEELAVDAEIPTAIMMAHMWNSMKSGLYSGMSGSNTHKQQFGYGSAGLIKYISRLPNGPGKVKAIYTSLSENTDTIQAVLKTMYPVSQHWGDYLVQLVTGKLYDLEIAEFFSGTDSNAKFKISSIDQIRQSKLFIRAFPDLSGTLFSPVLNATVINGLNDHHALSTKLQLADESSNALRLFLVKARSTATGVVEGELIGAAVKANGGLKIDVPNIKQLYADGWKISQLVVNQNAVTPYDDKIESTLTMAITSDEEKLLDPMQVQGHQVYGAIPLLQCNGSLKATGWSDYEMSDLISSSDLTIPHLDLKVPGAPPLVDLTYQATVLNNTAVTGPDSHGYYDRWTSSPLENYELKGFSYDKDATEPGESPDIFLTSADGHFQFQTPNDAYGLAGTITVSYKITRQTFKYDDNGNEVLLGGPMLYDDVPTLILIFFMGLG